MLHTPASENRMISEVKKEEAKEESKEEKKEVKKEEIDPNAAAPGAPKPPGPVQLQPEDIVKVGLTSSYYSFEERAHDEMKYVEPISTTGFFGLGYVDLSSQKVSKFGVQTNVIPSEIVNKLVNLKNSSK